MRNATCSTAEALRRFEPVLAAARRAGVQVRGYVSCLVGCPYEGSVDPTRVAEVAAYFLNVNRNKLGIVMALRERGTSGLGQFVESTPYDSALSILHPHTANWLYSGKAPASSPKRCSGCRSLTEARQRASAAHASASAPAGMHIGDDGSVAARHTASATSCARVTGDDVSANLASTLLTSSA